MSGLAGIGGRPRQFPVVVNLLESGCVGGAPALLFFNRSEEAVEYAKKRKMR